MGATLFGIAVAADLLGNLWKNNAIVSAWSKADGFCLGQKAVTEKRNEITAIPKLLDQLQIKGQIITIDIMGTQTAIAEKIRNKRADYVLALKRNQRGSVYGSVGILCRGRCH